MVKKESHRDVGGFTLDTDSGLLHPGPDCSFFTILLGQLTTPGKAGSKLQTAMHIQYLPPGIFQSHFSASRLTLVLLPWFWNPIKK